MVKRIKANDYGFTLVELIIVLMVLSILSTILIPLMYGFLDSLNEKDMYTDVENIRKYAQVALYDLYSDMSYNKDNHDSILDTGNITFDSAMNGQLNNFRDCDLHKSDLAKEIMSEAGFEITCDSPNIVLLCLGRYDYYTDPTNDVYDPLKAYTIYGMVYQPYANGKVYYLCGGDDPLDKDQNVKRVWDTKNEQYYNRIKVNGEYIYIQYYLLKSYNNNKQDIGNTFWNYVNQQKDKYNKS